MRHLRRNRASLARPNLQNLPSDLKRSDARQDKKELVSMLMVVANLTPPGRNALLDDAEPRRLQQVPAIAISAPHVMLCVVLADNFRHSFFLIFWRLTLR